MKKFLSFIAALTISATSMADITASEIQQALHALQPVTDTPVASDHVFTCRDRFIVRCDADNNIFNSRSL